MPRFAVELAETTDLPVADNEPRPIVRNAYWEGNADDEEFATAAGYSAWDRKYLGTSASGNITT